MTEFNAGCDPCRVTNNGEAYVQIKKLFGPLIACDARVRLDLKTGEWVIEREVETTKDQKGVWWQEMCRFDCQESLNLNEDE